MRGGGDRRREIRDSLTGSAHARVWFAILALDACKWGPAAVPDLAGLAYRGISLSVSGVVRLFVWV